MCVRNTPIKYATSHDYDIFTTSVNLCSCRGLSHGEGGRVGLADEFTVIHYSLISVIGMPVMNTPLQ